MTCALLANSIYDLPNWVPFALTVLVAASGLYLFKLGDKQWVKLDTYNNDRRRLEADLETLKFQLAEAKVAETDHHDATRTSIHAMRGDVNATLLTIVEKLGHIEGRLEK